MTVDCTYTKTREHSILGRVSISEQSGWIFCARPTPTDNVGLLTLLCAICGWIIEALQYFISLLIIFLLYNDALGMA